MDVAPNQMTANRPISNTAFMSSMPQASQFLAKESFTVNCF